MEAQRGGAARWRSRLRRELTWLMMLKVAALALLWALFFSAAHRPGADAQATSQRLGVGSRTPAELPAAGSPRPGAGR